MPASPLRDPKNWHFSRNTAPAWAIIAVSLVVTVIASLQVKQALEADTLRRFSFSCDQVTLKIQTRLDTYATILRGASALFAASEKVNRKEWRAYVHTLELERDIIGWQGIGYSLAIPPDKLASHISEIRSEGFPGYKVWPKGKRSIYTSIIFLEPFSGRNLRAFGFDMFSEATRRSAMIEARDTDKPALSGKVTLVQEMGKEVQAGTLMYVPVYRNGAAVDTLEQRRADLVGWVYSPYRMNDLMTGILNNSMSREGKVVDLQIYAGPKEAPDELLFNSKSKLSIEQNSLLHLQRKILFGGQQWLLVFEPSSTAYRISYAPAWFTLVGGLAVSGLLWTLMLALINTQINSMSITKELTERIKSREELLGASEDRWKFAVEGSQYARTLIETNLDPLVTISSDGLIQDVNEAMVQATGLPRLSLVGQDFSDFFTEPEKARAGYRQALAQGSVKDYALSLKHVSGRLMYVLYNASIYLDSQGQVAGIFGAARDITARKQIEADRQRLSEELEQRVLERTAELLAANQELEAFSYSVSHDLRAPLRAVDGFSRKILIGYGDKLDAEGLRLLQVVRQNAVRMGKLIDDLLAFSRLGRREMHLVPVDMEAMANATANELIELEPERQINFTCQAIPKSSGDPAMLKEIWVNLLSNAIKFTRKQNPAHINVGGQIEGNDTVYWVQDDGVGFDMAYADKLFGVFQRLHSQAEFEGSGVGLALSQRIIHRHHGRIWGESQIGHGAKLTFTLPLQRHSQSPGTNS